MRVRFGRHIDFCERITYNGGTILFITTMHNHIYAVECESESLASRMYEQALTDGHLDVSGLKYSNG